MNRKYFLSAKFFQELVNFLDFFLKTSFGNTHGARNFARVSRASAGFNKHDAETKVIRNLVINIGVLFSSYEVNVKFGRNCQSKCPPLRVCVCGRFFRRGHGHC